MGNEARQDNAEGALAPFEREVSRRDLLKVVGASAGVAALSPIIAACGGGGGGGQRPGGGAGQAATLAPGQASPGQGKIAPPANNVNLEFWTGFTGEDGPFMKALVDQFNKENPKVQVKFTIQKDLYGALRAAKAANRLPQVSIIHLDAIPGNAEDQIFQPIDEFIQQLGLQATDFTQDVWQNGEWKGKRYGVPLDIHTMNMYWNKELFRQADLDPDKAPATREEFLSAARAITEKAGVPGFMVVQGGPGARFLIGIQWATYFYQQGGQLYSEDYSRSTFNTDAGVEAINYIKSFLDAGTSPKGVESDSEIAAFQQKKNGIVLSGVWTTNAYLKALGNDLGAAPAPKVFGNGVWAGSHHLGMPNRRNMSQDEKQGVFFFIDWISTHSVDWAKAGQIPARQQVRESPEFKQVPVIPVVAEQVPDAKFFPPIPQSPVFVFDPGGIGEAVVNAITGRAQPKAALDAAAQNIDKRLQQNKQKFGY